MLKVLNRVFHERYFYFIKETNSRPNKLHSNKNPLLNFDNLFTYFFCQIYPPFTKIRIASLYFGRNVCTSLVVSISKVSGPPVFHIKVGRPVKYLTQGHNKRTSRLVLHILPLMPIAKQESCGYHFPKSFGMTRQGD